jgi:predicted RNA-binding protein associated with RNAse of E/G family
VTEVNAIKAELERRGSGPTRRLIDVDELSRALATDGIAASFFSKLLQRIDELHAADRSGTPQART